MEIRAFVFTGLVYCECLNGCAAWLHFYGC